MLLVKCILEIHSLRLPYQVTYADLTREKGQQLLNITMTERDSKVTIIKFVPRKIDKPRKIFKSFGL